MQCITCSDDTPNPALCDHCAMQYHLVSHGATIVVFCQRGCRFHGIQQNETVFPSLAERARLGEKFLVVYSSYGCCKCAPDLEKAKNTAYRIRDKAFTPTPMS